MSDITGRVVIVTGGAGGEGGLGLTAAEALAREGARVVVWDHSEEAIANAKVELESQGLSVEFTTLDVTNSQQVQDAYNSVIERYGIVDGLVNNAAQKMGFVRGRNEAGERGSADFWELDVDRVRQLLEVNFIGPLITSAVVAPDMIAKGHGSIINVITSPHTKVSPLHIPYGPSKSALESMTIAMATQMKGTGVRANSILPGRSANRRGEFKPEDAPFDCMVAPILWLISDDSVDATGRTFAGTEFETPK